MTILEIRNMTEVVVHVSTESTWFSITEFDGKSKQIVQYFFSMLNGCKVLRQLQIPAFNFKF